MSRLKLVSGFAALAIFGYAVFLQATGRQFPDQHIWKVILFLNVMMWLNVYADYRARRAHKKGQKQ